MNPSKIKAIVFDLGNVLIPFDYGITIKKFNEIESGLGDIFYSHYKANYHIHRDFEKGKIPEKIFINKMLQVLNNKIDAHTFCECYSDIFTVNEELTALLPELKLKYKLFLLSNTDSLHQKYGWQKYSFLDHFDKLILSHEVGALKPEKEIYHAVESVSGFTPSEHFFIDDVLEYVNAARDIGWCAVQFINNKKLLEDFGRFGIV